MKGDIPAAALRASACCIVRTHEQKRPTISKQLAHYYQKVRALKPGVGRGGNQPGAKCFLIDGRRYESMKAVCTSLHIGHNTFYKWLDTGRAKRI